MRLLKRSARGELSLTKNFIEEDIPPYAILSHTWGPDEHEVTFNDLENGSGKSKVGRFKIQFCGEQASRDNLQHFWVDTCCIDKANHTELSEAITSMFRWYRDAVKCYVYLSDVSARKRNSSDETQQTQESAFRQSRWFKRGWTLQELIAPQSVEFFSREGERLGDKNTLEQEIHEITGIPVSALRGAPLSQFSIYERKRWAETRETRRKEDKAYCLLGIFNVSMSLRYGEGENALVRFQKKVEGLLPTSPNPSDRNPVSQVDQLLKLIPHLGNAAYNSYENQRHRPCLADTRVDLLREITDWAMTKSDNYIFWLRGRAGTGKSTIALTVAQSLDRKEVSLASFFFKRGGGDLARSRKVVSTIAFQLATRSSLFGRFVCEALQEEPNLGESASLSEQYDKLLLRPLQRIQTSTSKPPVFIVVLDALDECDDFDDVRLLLRLLENTNKSGLLGLRMLVTSRPEIPIRLGFNNMQHIAYHELALHDIPRAIVDQDIEKFVAHELAQIRTERKLPSFWPGDDKIKTITTRADGLFIYAATVCRYVNGPRQVSVAARLGQVCQGSRAKHKSTEALDEMYLMVLDHSMNDDFSADEEQEVTLRFRQIVGTIVLLLDNLSAEELERLVLPAVSAGGAVVQDTLDSLHAILDVPEDPCKPVQMLHLSFRDFLVDSTRCIDSRFHINEQQTHHALSIYCLDLMKQSLVQNVCQLPGPGNLVPEVSDTTLSRFLPLGLRYACRHWIEHAEQGHLSLDDDGLVHKFLQQYCPYWLEVMSLVGKIPEAMTAMRKLGSRIQVNTAPELHLFVRDTLRFMLTFHHVLTKAPLQLYYAGLVFSPIHSIFRRSAEHLTSAVIKVRTQLLGDWNACIQTLEGHSNDIGSVIFSPDGSRVLSGSWDSTVRIWDVETGDCQHTLEGHSLGVHSAVFSRDGCRVASCSWDTTVRVWDVHTGECQYTLQGHTDSVFSVVFSPDGSRVASSSRDATIRVWDVQTGEWQHTLEDHSDGVNCVVFSPDGSRLVSCSVDMTVRVWDAQTGRCQHILEGHSDWVNTVAFSPDGSQVVSSSLETTLRIWDVHIGMCQHKLEGHSDSVQTAVFSPCGSRVASGSNDKTVRVWDVQTGECQHVLDSHSATVYSVAFSPDGFRVGSSSDKSVRIWDVQTGELQHTLEGHSSSINSVVFSPNGSRIASGSRDGMVRVWDVQTYENQHALEGQHALESHYNPEGHSDSAFSVVISPDGSRVASGSSDTTLRMWDVQTGECLYVLRGHTDSVFSLAFSPNGSQIVSGSWDKTVRVWDVRTGKCQHILDGHLSRVHKVVFSPDGAQVASCSWDKTLRVWDVQTGECQQTLEGHSDGISCVIFSPNGSQVVSGSWDGTVRVWDVQTGKCQRTLEGQRTPEGHSDGVNRVMFSPDGLLVASGSWDGTLRVWDDTSSTEILYHDIGTKNYTIEFSDDSRMIMANEDLLSIPSQTPFNSTPATPLGFDPSMPVSKMEIRGDWVISSGESILWLPPEYRPGDWASKDDTIVIGSGTGRVTFVHRIPTIASS